MFLENSGGDRAHVTSNPDKWGEWNPLEMIRDGETHVPQIIKPVPTLELSDAIKKLPDNDPVGPYFTEVKLAQNFGGTGDYIFTLVNDRSVVIPAYKAS